MKTPIKLFSILILFILNIYAQANNTSLQLTQNEKDWLKQNPKIDLVGVGNFEPFLFQDENAKPIGILPEYLRRISEILNHNIQISNIASNAKEAHKLVQENKSLGLSSAFDTPYNLKTYHLGKPYTYSPLVIFTNKNNNTIKSISDLNNKKIAILESISTMQKYLQSIKAKEIVFVKTPQEQLSLLQNGEVDAVIGFVTYHKLINHLMLTNIKIAYTSDTEQALHFAINKNHPELSNILNKAIKKLTRQTYLDIRQKWTKNLSTNTSLKTTLKLSTKEQNYLDKKPYLSVMSFENFQPFSFRQNGEPKGYSVETMKLIAKLLNKEIKFIKKPWNEQLQMLKNGELDVIPHLAVTPERKTFAAYTDFIHITFLIGFATPRDIQLHSMEDLKDKRLAVVEGYYLHEHLKNKFPNIKLVTTKSTEEAIQVVAQGKADAVVDNIPTLNYFIQEKWLSNLKIANVKDFGMPMQTQMPMGVNKNNLILKSILEKANNAIPMDEVSKLKQTWMLNEINDKPNQLNENEKNFLEKKPTIKFLIRKNSPPFDFNENDEAKGLAVDYIKLIGEKIGFEPKFVSQNISHKEVSKMLIEGTDKFDTVAFMVKNKNREKIFSFGIDYLSYPMMIISHKNSPYIGRLSDLNGKNIVIEKDYLTNKWIQKDYPGINILSAKDTSEALKMVNEEKADAYVGNLGIANYMMTHGELNNLKIAAPSNYGNVNYSFVAPKKFEELSSILTKGYNQISPKEHNLIQQKWFSTQTIEKIDYELVWEISIASIIIIIWFIWWNRKTHKINKQLDNLNREMEGYINLIDKNIITSSTDLNGTITQVSKAFCDISGYSKEELIGKNHRIICHPDMNRDIYEQLWKTIINNNTWKGEIKNKKKCGSCYWVDATISPIFNEKRQKIGYTSIRQDITDKKLIEKISITDGLTNIHNRRHFNEIFPKYINSAKRDNKLISFMIMDIDNFKLYNDTYGHQRGDKVLIKIAKELKNILHRADDYCFRLGGEEFAVLFKPESKEQAIKLAELIKNSIENLKIEHKNNTASKYVTTSIGLICKKSGDIKDEEQIYKETDDLLYRAKHEGRNRINY